MDAPRASSTNTWVSIKESELTVEAVIAGAPKLWSNSRELTPSNSLVGPGIGRSTRFSRIGATAGSGG